MEKSNRFMQACHGKAVDRTPIWLMRQAGRYMPEYRNLKGQRSILDLIKNPEVAVEITLQPLNAFDLDAAIIFSDILPILEGMGLTLEFLKGDGPVIYNPLRSAKDIRALETPPAVETLHYTLKAIEMVRKELDGNIPLIGFSGAPFTLASYAIEGGASRDFKNVKHLMYSQPDLWKNLMEKFTIATSDYLISQVDSGVDALQIFDSWVGNLSPFDFRHYVLPFTQRVIKLISDVHPRIPIIYFGTGTSGFLPLCKSTGANVIGVDWRIDLAYAWSIMGKDVGIQGNLDPMILTGPIPEIKKQTMFILDSMQGKPGYIFNLGHGILKHTPVENVKFLVDFVHEYSESSP